MSPKVETTNTRAKKDPNAPKKPMTAFVIFCGDHRDKVRKENPDIKVQDVQRKLAELWNKVTDSEKKKYEAKAAEAKEKYTKAVAEYKKSPQYASFVADSASAKKDAGGKKRAKKDKNAPKKATTAFMAYSKANREAVKKANPTATFGELGKILGAKWHELSDSEKQKYEKEAEKDKARYAAEMKDYNDGAKAATGAKKVEATKAKAPAKKKVEESESEGESYSESESESEDEQYE